ncbi:MAG: superoxide dismutase family protein [Gammaproteobacteria bacterium]|nr:superoxide dismutase family protein [Gammaproteobacteria bacterium]
MFPLKIVIGAGAGALLLVGGYALANPEQTSAPAPGSSMTAMQPKGAQGVAVIHPASGSDVHGTVWFVPVEGGVRITGEIKGLSPGLHGFHIHRFGDCSARDASSAGGHYNPENEPHGAPTAEKHHAGDLGNIRANDVGVADVKMTVPFITVNEMYHHPVLGRAVIVHAKKDHFDVQPSGAAGPRIGCGVIGLAGTQ